MDRRCAPALTLALAEYDDAEKRIAAGVEELNDPAGVPAAFNAHKIAKEKGRVYRIGE